MPAMESTYERTLSPADAEARLRYLAELRTSARRAVLLPSLGLLIALGVVVASHGALTALWPHGAVVTVAWVAALVLARPALRRWATGALPPRGIERSLRLPLLCAAVAVAAAILADLAGANPLISAIAAGTALRAALAGMPAVAAGALLAGAVGDAMLLEGVAPSTGDLLIGAALVAGGLALAARERRRA
jgi:hypothetical protein